MMMNKDTAASHFDTHMRLLSRYRSLNGARYGSMTAGALLATVLLSVPDPDAISIGLTGLALLPIGYLLKFPADAASRSLRANWKKAFSGTTWRTVGGEIGVVTKTDEYGNDICLSFNGKVSNEKFGLASLEPVSEKARDLEWQTLDGRIGVVRAAESCGNGDTGWVDYLTIGFDDGSEYRGEKSEMNPVHP
jgi:hypothetical protein